MTFGADIIAGFPTETEEMFQRSLSLVDDCGLTWLHVFPYSPRNGTPAARMPQVPGAAIKSRAARLRAAGDAAAQRHLTAQIGQTHRVLLENPRMGRTEQFTEVTFATDQPEGAIINARITDTQAATYCDQRVSASSSASFAATQPAPSGPISFFQNGARDFR